jgi:transposase-like protein
MEKRKVHSLKAKKEALKAMSEGMSNKDIAVITGINIHTLTLWKTKLKNGKITPDGISTTKPKDYICKECGEVFQKVILYAQHTAVKHPKKTTKKIKHFCYKNTVKLGNPTSSIIPPSLNNDNQSLSRISLDEFIQLLRDLTTDYIKLKEELAFERKSKEEWRIRAGHFLEQAQQSINR